MNMHSTRILFSPKQGPPPFGATMSRLRFHFNCSHLCFYNPDAITEHCMLLTTESRSARGASMLLTTESRSARGASRHPAFMDGSLTVSQTRLPCPPCGKMRLQVLDCGDGNK